MRCRVLQSVVVVLLAVLTALSSNTAQAGILVDTANAIPGFQGTRLLSNVDEIFGDEVNVDFDFAAFAPVNSGSCTFDQFLTEFGVAYPSAVPDDHYVYAYQVHVLSTTCPSAETITVGTTLSGSLGGDAPSFIPLSYYGSGTGGNGDEEPRLVAYQGVPVTSALWEYTEDYQGQLGPGEWTAIMFFSSTHGPIWDSAQVSAGMASGKSNLDDLTGTGVPSPSPEPSTWLLLGVGAVCVAVWSRRRGTR